MTSRLQVALPDIGDFKDVPVIELLAKPATGSPSTTCSSASIGQGDDGVPRRSPESSPSGWFGVGDRVSTGTPIVAVDVPARRRDRSPPPRLRRGRRFRCPPRPRRPPPPLPHRGAGGEVPRTPSVRAYARTRRRPSTRSGPAVRPGGCCARTCRLSCAAPSTRRPPLPSRLARSRPRAGPACTRGPRRPTRRGSGRCGASRCRASSRSPAPCSRATGLRSRTSPTSTTPTSPTPRRSGRPQRRRPAGAAKITMVAFLIKASAVALRPSRASTPSSTAPT